MGAIAGVFHPGPGPVAPVVPLLRPMDARGPEAREVAAFERGALGACVGTGGAPAWDAAGRWLVVLSEAPTNTRALRSELVARGRAAAEASPSALAAAVFAEIGIERGLGRLEGDAALAAWDAEEHTLYLVRDRVGLNPLHVATLPGGTVVFASDLGALAGHPGVSLTPTPAGVANLAVLGLVPPPDTLVGGVVALAPGTFRRFGPGGPAELRWWALAPSPVGAGGAAARWATSLRLGVELATRHRLGEDVAVACGGGLFSRSLAAIADPGGRPLPAVRFGPGGAVDLAPEDLPGVLEEMAQGLGEPVVAAEAIGWWVVARRAWEDGRDALLTGLGGDAAFRVPGAGRVGRLARTLGLRRPLPPGWARGVVAADDPAPVWEGLDLLEAACPADQLDSAVPWLIRGLVLPGRRLAAAERACAAFGLRLLAPLADPRLLTLAASIPLEHHRAAGKARALYARAVADLVPVSPPPGEAFPLPLASWLRGPCRALLTDLPERAAAVVDTSHTRVLVDGHLAGRFDAAGRLWALLMIERWGLHHRPPPPTSPSWADSGPPI